MVNLLFSISLLLSASLFFAIQLMVAKSLLPMFGGTPGVWTITVMFFQVLLLGGYAYSWCLNRAKNWRFIHLGLGLLTLCFFPLRLKFHSASFAPEIEIIWGLLRISIPLLLLAASAPLLQFAFSQVRRESHDPYYLYAASNAGSLLALLSYPFLVERFLDLQQQFAVWNGLFITYLVLIIGIFIFLQFQKNTLDVGLKVQWSKKLFWIYLGFVPCSLMMGVTSYVSTDISSTPFVWILPLSLYLLSFMATFTKKPWISSQWVECAALFLLLPMSLFMYQSNHISAWLQISLHLVNLFMWAVLFNSKLMTTRPPAAQLTTFYLCLASGGAAAGLFNGIIAPNLFAQCYEYPLVLLSAVLGFFVWKKNKAAKWVALTGLALLTASLYYFWGKSSHALAQHRNFFGVKQVYANNGAHVLMSQSTVHGFQMGNAKESIKGGMAYYGVSEQVVKTLQKIYQPLHALVVGLGTGIMVCQFHADDQLTMVEIDPQVLNIAQDPKLFTYLSQCPAKAKLLVGDGRSILARQANEQYELLVIDAFNSDAIPIHLLTREAFKLYEQKLTKDGIILIHISNRHLHLLPVLVAQGRALEWIVLYKRQEDDPGKGVLASEWAALTSNISLASQLMAKEGWQFITEGQGILWTDNFSNILPLVQWSTIRTPNRS